MLHQFFSSRFNRAIFMGLLFLYILAGAKIVPFHGDESTLVFQSRDWYTLLSSPQDLFYQNPTPNADFAAAQELRLLNGTIPKFGAGALESLAGFPADALNQQWIWGADLEFNRAQGHVPSDSLLFTARLASALMLCVSGAILFAIAYRWISPIGAWITTAVYVLNPAVLLNGRRSMFEGAMLLGLMIVLVLIPFPNTVSNTSNANQPRHALNRWVVFGLACGVALAAKHTNAMPLVGIFGLLLLIHTSAEPSWSRLIQTASKLVGAGALAAFTFFALNPAWWSAPLEVPREVIRLRGEILSGQTQLFGGYTNWGDRVEAVFANVLYAPQYYEDSRGWPDWIGDQIRVYESSGLLGFVAPIPILMVACLGGILLLRSKQGATKKTFIVFLWAFVAIVTVILTPLAWQRYYLPLAPFIALLCGGVGLLFPQANISELDYSKLRKALG